MVRQHLYHSTLVRLMAFTNGEAYDDDDIKPCAKEWVKSSVWEKRCNMCYSTRLWMNEWLLDLASAIAPWPWLLNETWHVIVSGVDGATPATERGNPISGRNARTVSASVHKFWMTSFRILHRCSLPTLDPINQRYFLDVRICYCRGRLQKERFEYHVCVGDTLKHSVYST